MICPGIFHVKTTRLQPSVVALVMHFEGSINKLEKASGEQLLAEGMHNSTN